MTSNVADALVGQLIDGRYRITEHLADGGMASVYVAMDARLDREVALKMMRPGLAVDSSFVERFRAEARASARLSHPNVVAVYDQGTDGDSVFLAMELVRGKTLREVIDDEAPFTPREAIAILEPVLLALRAAHTAGLIHRDVKPENVIVRTDGEVKVADFGLARAIDTATAHSQSGLLLGTVSYLSPEQVEHGSADQRSDIYAAGLLLFEMLTGRKAVTGQTAIQIAFQHVQGRVPPPSTVVAPVPPELDAVVATAAARDPEQRYTSAAEFLGALRLARRALTPARLDRRPEPLEGNSLNQTTALPTGPALAETRPLRPLSVVGSSRRARSAPEPTRALSEDGRPARATKPGPAASENGGSATTGAASRDARPEPSPSTPARLRVASTATHEPTRALERSATEPDSTGPRRGTWLVVGLLLLALLAAGGSGWWFTNGPGSMTLAPTVAQLDESAALAALEKAGLRADTSEAFSETVPAGTVISGTPPAGAEVRKSSVVRLVVSKGLERYTVPGLVGTKADDAAGVVSEQPLRLERGEDEFSETVPVGVVISQTPAANEKVKRDTTVTVVVSKGREPITVPVVTGKSAAVAEKTLTDAGLRMTRGEDVNSDTVPAGAVISQKPAEGTLFRGDVVSVVVSKGPVMVTVPNVVGSTQAQAKAALEKAGLKPAFTFPLGAPILDIVRGQDKRSGSSVPKGSTVSVSVV